MRALPGSPRSPGSASWCIHRQSGHQAFLEPIPYTMSPPLSNHPSMTSPATMRTVRPLLYTLPSNDVFPISSFFTPHYSDGFLESHYLHFPRNNTQVGSMLRLSKLDGETWNGTLTVLCGTPLRVTQRLSRLSWVAKMIW